MIITSPLVDLTPSAGINADSPLIGWRDIVTTLTLTADGEDADFPAVNLANPSTALLWKGADDGEQHLTITASGAGAIDYVAIARHNFGSAGITVSVEGRATGDSPDIWRELVPETVPDDDAPLIFRFEPEALTLVRVRLQPPTGGIPQAAVLYVGRLLILERRIYVGHTPLPMGRETRSTVGMSESGNFLGRIITGEHLTTGVELSNLTPAWYRANLDPFIEAAQEEPFFFAWRPGAYPEEVGFAWLTNNPRPVNQRSNGMMQVSLQMGGIAT